MIVSFEDMQKNLFVLQKMICNLEKLKMRKFHLPMCSEQLV